MKTIVTHKIFGKDSKPTIYYLVGYGGKIDHYKLHINIMVKAGFRVVAFEYDKSIVDNGDPELLIGSLEQITVFVKNDRREHLTAGIFGVSLGTWLGFNVMIKADIKTGYYLSGGVNIVNTIWNKPNLAAAKQAFIANGFSNQTLHTAMVGYDFDEDTSRMRNRRYVLVISRHDNVIDFNEASHNFKSWHKSNPESRQITYKRYGHWQIIIRGLLNVRSTISFFKV